MFKSTAAKTSICLICFLIGLLAVMQMRTQSRMVKSAQAQSSAEQGRVINDLIDSNAALRNEIYSLEEDVTRYERAAGKSELDSIVGDLNRLRMINGLVEASGPGVEVTLDQEVSETDMQDMVNELRNAGAEAIAIGSQRIVGRSVIVKDAGPGLVIDEVRLTGPYTLKAIGNADTLERALERKGGLVVILRYNYPDQEFKVEKKDRIVLPIYRGKQEFIHSQPAR